MMLLARARTSHPVVFEFTLLSKMNTSVAELEVPVTFVDQPPAVTSQPEGHIASWVVIEVPSVTVGPVIVVTPVKPVGPVGPEAPVTLAPVAPLGPVGPVAPLLPVPPV
jgi:hypothetical protein